MENEICRYSEERAARPELRKRTGAVVMVEHRSIQAANMNQGATLFDYSESEWKEIDAAVSAIRNGGLSEFAQQALLRSARRYRLYVLQPKPAKRKRQWQQIAHRAEKLRGALLICAEQRLTDLRADWDQKEIIEIVGAIYDRLLKGLVELRDTATAHVNFYIPNGPYDFDSLRLPFDMNKPRMRFQFEILQIWWGLGGKLRFSRTTKSGKISGPLARYFFAVMRPVSGPSTPSPETLPDIVERFKGSIIDEAKRAAKGRVG